MHFHNWSAISLLFIRMQAKITPLGGNEGGHIAQSSSRRLPTAEAQVSKDGYIVRL
jgi:hypothetical protein